MERCQSIRRRRKKRKIRIERLFHNMYFTSRIYLAL
jgi:hypothetical protein